MTYKYVHELMDVSVNLILLKAILFNLMEAYHDEEVLKSSWALSNLRI